MKTNSHSVKIFIAGDLYKIRTVCRHYCLCGLCVTVTPTEFIYTGGAETGAEIGLINYARFPMEAEKIDEHMFALAKLLMNACCQKSCSVVTPTESHYLQNDNIEVKR